GPGVHPVPGGSRDDRGLDGRLQPPDQFGPAGHDPRADRRLVRVQAPAGPGPDPAVRPAGRRLRVHHGRRGAGRGHRVAGDPPDRGRARLGPAVQDGRRGGAGGDGRLPGRARAGPAAGPACRGRGPRAGPRVRDAAPGLLDAVGRGADAVAVREVRRCEARARGAPAGVGETACAGGGVGMSRLYETMFRTVLYPAYESGLMRRGTLRYLREYEDTQWLSADEILALQWRKLEALLDSCWERIPYYRARWRELGIERGDIRGMDDYARLPVLGKDEIRAHHEDFLPSRPDQPILFKATSGSTGEPLRVGFTRESYERRIAVMYRGYGWSGGHHGRRTLYLWGQPAGGMGWKERLYQSAFQRRTLNAFHMTAERMAAYADAF